MKKNIFLVLLLYSLFVTKISAGAPPLEIINGGLSSGTDSPCGNQAGYVACYSPKYQFRVTLINDEGKKVFGTSSVDFSYATDEELATTVYDESQLNAKGVYLVNNEYEYKYSDINNDYNNRSNFKYITINMPYEHKKYKVNGKNDDPNQYSVFYNKFASEIMSRNEVIYFKGGKGNKYSDFTSVFLFHSGFIKEEKNIDHIEEKASEISENNYFLLIEPTYTIYYNTEPDSNKFYYKYGTGSEILEWIESEGRTKNTKYNQGYLAGLSANFAYQVGCNLYTIPNNFKMDEGKSFVVKNSTVCSLEQGIGSELNASELPSRNERLVIMNEILNKSSGYTAATLQLRKLIPEIIKKPKNIELDVDLCKNNDGEISFKMNDKTDDNIYIIDEFKVGGVENSKLYCYDEVNYNFNSTDKTSEEGTIGIMKLFAGKEFKTPTTLKISPVYVTINRTCYFKSNQVNITDAQSIEEYKDISIQINGVDDNSESLIELKKTNSEINPIFSQISPFTGEGKVNYEITLTYEYKNANGKNEYYLSPNKNYTGTGYVSVSVNNIDEMFGYSNKMISKLLNGSETKTINGIDYTYSLRYLDGDNTSDNLKCNFKYTIDSNGINESLQFRVISLSNPFPARDGTSRLPGTNWLDAKNYVYDYIDNNRAIQYKLGEIKENTREFKENGKADPNAMYTNTEPMYVIDLDASTMKKIREYNKDHTYTDIKLKCDSNNRQCTSYFLRNEIEGENIPIKLTGVCSNKDDYNEVLVNYNGITEERLRKVIYGGGFYQKRYDINKNLRNDTDDLEIFLNETDKDAKPKNTFFYRCADKTYLSGG